MVAMHEGDADALGRGFEHQRTRCRNGRSPAGSSQGMPMALRHSLKVSGISRWISTVIRCKLFGNGNTVPTVAIAFWRRWETLCRDQACKACSTGSISRASAIAASTCRRRRRVSPWPAGLDVDVKMRMQCARNSGSRGNRRCCANSGRTLSLSRRSVSAVTAWPYRLHRERHRAQDRARSSSRLPVAWSVRIAW